MKYKFVSANTVNVLNKIKSEYGIEMYNEDVKRYKWKFYKNDNNYQGGYNICMFFTN